MKTELEQLKIDKMIRDEALDFIIEQKIPSNRGHNPIRRAILKIEVLRIAEKRLLDKNILYIPKAVDK